MNLQNTIMSEVKTMKTFPYNKPWVSTQLKSCLNESRVAFYTSNVELLCE